MDYRRNNRLKLINNEMMATLNFQDPGIVLAG